MKVPHSVRKYLFVADADEVLPDGFTTDAAVRKAWTYGRERVKFDKELHKSKYWLWAGAYSKNKFNLTRPSPICYHKGRTTPQRLLYFTLAYPHHEPVVNYPGRERKLWHIEGKNAPFWDVNPWNYNNTFLRNCMPTKDAYWAELALGIFDDPHCTDDVWQICGYSEEDLFKARRMLDTGEFKLYYPERFVD